jgi:hypothetical protein
VVSELTRLSLVVSVAVHGNSRLSCKFHIQFNLPTQTYPMSLLARSAIRSVYRSAPRRGARFYSEDVATVVEPTAKWRAEQEALKHHAHGKLLDSLYISF